MLPVVHVLMEPSTVVLALSLNWVHEVVTAVKLLYTFIHTNHIYQPITIYVTVVLLHNRRSHMPNVLGYVHY